MSTGNVKDAWSKVAEELSSLGLKLKYHVEEEFTDDDGTNVKEALQRLADAIDDTVDAASNAAKDPAVRENVKSTGAQLISALSTTIDQAVKSVTAAVPKKDQ